MIQSMYTKEQVLNPLINQAQVIAKVTQVLNPEEQDILIELMRTGNIFQAQNDVNQQGEQKPVEENDLQAWGEKQEQYRKFLRKAPNFFLAMFKKWLTSEGYYYESKFLQQIRNQKQSKQHRYELCDFRICFSTTHIFECKVIDLKPLFNDFLKNSAKIRIQNNNKASLQNKVYFNQEVQEKYISHIEQLLIELEQEQPFKNYYKLMPLNGRKQQFSEEIQDQKTKKNHNEESINSHEVSFSNNNDNLDDFFSYHQKNY